MATVLHHEIHLPHMPEAVAPTVHWLERVAGAVFFTILAPLAFATFLVAGLLLAMGIARFLF